MSSTVLFPFLTDEAKRARLISLREAVTPILANNLQTEFTDHSCDHSDAVASLVSQLIGPLQSGPHSLNQRELFVLYAASYLHDIGMQYENAGHTRTIQAAGLGGDWASLSREVRAAHLRQLHPALAAEMVVLSVRSSSPPTGLTLTDEDDPQLIALLCESHGLDVESMQYQALSANPSTRLDLLAGLLRMADILEESSRRAKRRKADTLLLPLESQAHWWRHYYTREVLFNAELKSITLIFDFPPARRSEYSDIVPSLNVPNIQDELRRHAQPFARYGVPWVIKPLVDDNPYGVAEDMPVEVILTMTGWLKNAAEWEAEARRKAVNLIYERVQPTLKRLIDEVEHLPPETSPLARAEKLVAVADHLRQLEAHRSEAAYVEQAYRLSEQAGDPALQLRLGLRLLPLRDRYGDELREQNLLTECERIAGAADATPEQRMEIAVLKARAYGDLCVHPSRLPEYRRIVTEAVSLAAALAESQAPSTLSIELAEVEWLLGESEAAMTTLTSSLSPVGTVQDAGAEPHPFVRAEVVRAHIAAGRGGIDEALASLRQSLDACVIGPEGVRSRVYLLNARAHLCYLADRAGDALQALTAALGEPDLHNLPRIRQVLDQNHLLCRLASSAPDRFQLRNELYDAGRLTSDVERDSTLLRALNDQKKGRHREALPAFWRELCQAYRSGGWERYWEAEEYYAAQCFHLGWLELTARHAIRGHSSGLVENTAKTLLIRRASETIRGVLSWLMENRLTRHYVIMCSFLVAVADAVPDEILSNLVTFLLSEGASSVAFSSEAPTVQPTWQALHALAPALNQTQAQQLLGAVKRLDLKSTNAFHLEKIIEVLDQLIPVLSEEALDQTADLLMPRAHGFPQDGDHQIYYANVLNALAHIWSRLGVSRGKNLADTLFPPGGPAGDVLKLTVLPLFNKFDDSDANRTTINGFAQNTAEMLRLQVQRFAPDDPADPQAVPWSLGTIAYQDQSGRRVMSMDGGLKDLWAAIACLEWLEPQTVETLLQSCLDAAADEENVISNRTSILQAVEHMGKRLSKEQREATRTVVLLLARGELIGEVNRNLHSNANNPLNPFKINLGDPGDLQGAALYCLAQIERDAPHPNFDWIWLLLEELIISPSAATRRHATTAAWSLPAINTQLFTALLCGLRDTDPHVASSSYWALASKENISLNDFSAGLLLASLERAAQNDHATIRAGASALVKRLAGWLPDTPTLQKRRAAIQRLFDCDICRSVRQAAYRQADALEQEPLGNKDATSADCFEVHGGSSEMAA